MLKKSLFIFNCEDSILWGTVVNIGTILIGTLLGSLLSKGIPEKVRATVMQGLGLAVLVIGMISAITTQEILLMIISLAVGGGIGRLIGIEDKLEKLGDRIQSKISKDGKSNISTAFMTATLIYLVGPMSILGSLDAGFLNNYDVLYVKSLLDGITSIVLGSTLGWGVALAAIPVLLYQGLITLCATWLSPFMTEALMVEISAIGGVLIMGIGINMLKIKKIRTGDLLPALSGPVIYFLINGLL